MKKYIIKSLFAFSVCAAIFTSCTSDDDFETPPFKEAFFLSTFNDLRYGTAQQPEYVNIDGVINTNLLAPARKWEIRSFNRNNYIQFSSYNTQASTNDEAWLILPAATLNANEKALFSLDIAQAFPTGTFPVSVQYSTDFDGNEANISTSTWQSIDVSIPSSTSNYEFVNKSNLEIHNTESETKDTYIAIKYVGSNNGGSTHTIQIDNLKLIKE